MQCISPPKSFEMPSPHPSAVNGAWGKINRMRLLWCACPVKTARARLCAFCIMHVWCTESMPAQCTHIIPISQVCGAGIKAARLCSRARITEQRRSRVSGGRMSLSSVFCTRALSYRHAGWGSWSAHSCGDISSYQSTSVKCLPDGWCCIITERDRCWLSA